MQMSENEHRRYIFEKMQAAIDTEITCLAQKQPNVDHHRVKRDVWKIMGEYLKSEQNASMTSQEEYLAGLRTFIEERYPRNAPQPEFESVLDVVRRVKARMGWNEISDTTIV